MKAEEYFKKWSENCRLFIDYKPIHSHEDMMQFAKDYFEHRVNEISDEDIRNESHSKEMHLGDFSNGYYQGMKSFKNQLLNK